LQAYLYKNLIRVKNFDFEASILTSGTRAIANALGACTIGSPRGSIATQFIAHAG
jgi:hypothetical protein